LLGKKGYVVVVVVVEVSRKEVTYKTDNDTTQVQQIGNNMLWQ